MKNGLFPTVPKDLTKLSDKELADLLAEFEEAAGLIDADDEEFLAGLSADEIIEQYDAGKDAILALRAEGVKRDEDAERFADRKAEIQAALKAEEDPADPADPDPADPADPDPEDPEAEAAAEVVAEAQEATAEAAAEEAVSDPVKEKLEAVAASADEPVVEEPKRPMRRSAPVPAPEGERIVVVDEKPPLSFVASGLLPTTPAGSRLENPKAIADACKSMIDALGRPSKSAQGREDKYRVASLDYRENYPTDRVLVAGDLGGNGEKLAAIYEMFAGSSEAAKALVASGGLCAPLEPIYTQPQYAVRDRPVKAALPNFRAERGGINVPTPTVMGDAAGAITVITEEEDALGGTFATKACLDLDCPTYTETAVTIISHCREYGNLVSMSWPEKIAHENELTMAEHARIAESYLLGRIKTLSVNVTNGAETLGALIYLVEGIMEAKFGIRSRLRMPNEARFTALLPRVLLDMLELDTVQTQFDRYRSRGEIEAYLGEKGIDVAWYMDTPLQVGDATAAPGDSQIADSSQAAGALDGFPNTVQWAIFPSGTFLHLDMAELNLGIVRDSTLNSTNDYQNFGESFENIARPGAAQAAYWVTTDLCPTGQFPPAGTARTCE